MILTVFEMGQLPTELRRTLSLMVGSAQDLFEAMSLFGVRPGNGLELHGLDWPAIADPPEILMLSVLFPR